MKTLRVACFSAQTGKSVSAGNNPDKAVAVSSRATGFDGGNLISGPGRPGPDRRRLEYIQAMFDCENPGRSGNLAGESFAAVLESHPRYQKLRSSRHRALFERLDDIVANHIDRRIMLGLGFDEIGVAIYRNAALTAFRAARPTN
jgi:hypothetical protein